MTVKAIRAALVQAKKDGKVDVADVDKIVLKARSGWGLDPSERAELVKMADSFDDPAKQRLLSHLSAMGQKNAWVNVEAGGLVSVKGRYANYSVGVPGLSAKLGLFDNCFSMKGAAKADGLMKVAIEGQNVSVNVKKGETAAQVLAKVQAALPAQVKGVLLQGDVQPYDGASYKGTTAAATDKGAHLMLYKPESLGLKPGELPLKVVVTGYGAFMGITDNPSANMAEKLAEAGVKGGIVEYRRLDVTPEAVDAFIGEMRKSPPDVILSMGVTGGQAQVEERPENHLGAAADGNNHQMADREVRAGGPQELNTDLPVETIDNALKPFGDQRVVGTSKSDPNYAPDRSAYLCNYLGYNLASEFGATPKTTAGFMHISRETPPDQMHAVLEAITARQLDMRREQQLPPS
jgi:pyrrolidone-carboxylate peptidase